MDNKNKIIVGIAIVLVAAVLFYAGILTGTTGGVTQKNYECYDSDNGDMYMKGTITGVSHNGQEFGSMTDYCTPDGKLKEYSCAELESESGWKIGLPGESAGLIICDNGCSNGACL